jgi:hypothetical protein
LSHNIILVTAATVNNKLSWLKIWHTLHQSTSLGLIWMYIG